MSILEPNSGEALQPIVAEQHYVNGNPLRGPWPENMLSIVLGKG